MILIAHRGNLNGPFPEKENHPNYIDFAISQGFDVEIDLWMIDGLLYLGHDKPQYKISESYLYNSKYWIHAKNINAARFLIEFKSLNWFFHDKDDCVLTSNGFLWTYPGKQLTNKSIAVMPEMTTDWDINNAYGICSDFIINKSACYI